VKTVCTKAAVAVLRYHSSTTSKDSDSRGTGPRTKGRMLVACRIGFLSTFVAAMGLSAVATQNVGASSEGPIGDQATISANSKVSSYIPLFGMDIAATIDSVDGKAIGAGTHKISVDPGIHTISLTCHAVGPTNTEEFDLSVLAGAHYQATRR
jgi:hypothetical protein